MGLCIHRCQVDFLVITVSLSQVTGLFDNLGMNAYQYALLH
jgi:hypothetical protein